MSSIEVSVWDGASLTTKLAVLENVAGVQWQEVLGDTGSGQCEIALADLKATSAILHKGNLVKVALGGQYVFAWFLRAPVRSVAEAGASLVKLAGLGALSYLGNAGVYPASYSGTGTYGTTRSFASTTFGNILNTLLTEAQTRGTIPALTWSFDATLDSRGVAWDADQTLDLDCKASLLDVAKKLHALGMGLWMSPDLVLYAYYPGTQGLDVSGSVIWQEGRHIIGQVDEVTSTSMQSVVLVAGAGGEFTEVTDAGLIADPYVGRIEGALDFSSSSDPTQMAAAGTQQLALTQTNATAISVPLNHDTDPGGFEPYVHYRVGDTVGLNVPPIYVSEAHQIVALTVRQLSNANYDVSANLDSISLPLELRNRQTLVSTARTTATSSGTTAGNLTLANPSPSGGGTGSGVEFTDGVHDVTGATKLTVSGATVGGGTPNATLAIPAGPLGTIVADFDGGGSALQPGKVQDVALPANGTLASWTVLADQSGTASVTVQKTTYASYGTGFASITGGSDPAISGVIKNQDGTLASWTKGIVAGNVLRFTLTPDGVITRLTLSLTYTRS